MRCSEDRGFDDPNDALSHLKKHLAKLPAVGPKPDEADLKDWIVHYDQYVREKLNGGVFAILKQARDDARMLFRETKELADGVRNPDGKMSPLYTFPDKLLKTLRLLVVFYLSVERAVYFTENHEEAGLREKGDALDAPDYQVPWTDQGLEVLTRFSESAKGSLAAVRRDLCQMTHTKSLDNWHKRLSLGPEYLCSWLMRRLLVKPVDNSMTTADLYREYLSTLVSDHHTLLQCSTSVQGGYLFQTNGL